MKDTRTHISRLHFATPEEQEKILDELDHLGFFMLPDENWSMFTERISLLQKVLGEIESGKIPPELRSHIQFREKISGDFTAEANRKLMEHYKFRNSWAPAFFSKEETGSFSAGVQLEVDETYPVIFLHDAFAEKNSHCGYDRTEILAHELIHAARMFFPPSRYEEYFTCHIYKSPLRRWMGNLFRSKYLITPFLAGFFGGSVSVSLGIPWGGFCFLLPVLILLYELHLYLRLAAAGKKLLLLQLDPLPVLLRLTDQEIFALGKMPVESGADLVKNSLRWKIFFRKFHL